MRCRYVATLRHTSPPGDCFDAAAAIFSPLSCHFRCHYAADAFFTSFRFEMMPLYFRHTRLCRYAPLLFDIFAMPIADVSPPLLHYAIIASIFFA